MDALNFTIAVDNVMARHWEPLAPHKNVFLLNSPREISGNIAIPKPVVSTISRFLLKRNPVIDPKKLAIFNSLPDA